MRAITSESELRALIGEPTDLVRAKLGDRMNELTRQFIARSPFVCVATADRDGGIDVSPRGDPPGFVRHGVILRRISLPDLDVAAHERERAARYARREGLY